MSEHDVTTEVKDEVKSISDLRRVLQDSKLEVTSYYSEAFGWSTDATKLLKDFSNVKDATDGISGKLADTAEGDKAGLADEFHKLVASIEAASKDAVPATSDDRKKRQATIDGIVKQAEALKTKVAASVEKKKKQDAAQAALLLKQQAEQAALLLKQDFESTVGTLLDTYATLLDAPERNNATEARKWLSQAITEKQAANVRAQILKCKDEGWAANFPDHAALAQSMSDADMQAPDAANTEQRGKVETLRTAMTKALAERPVTANTLKEARKQAALIKTECANIIAANLDARIEENKRLRGLLDEPSHAVPAGASPEQAKPIDQQRQAALKTLAIDPPTAASLKQATTELAGIKSAVAKVAQEVAAATLAIRAKSVQDSFAKLRFDKIDLLVGKSADYDADKKALGAAMGGLAGNADETAVKLAEQLVEKIKGRVGDLKRDYDTQIAGYQTALKSYAYLDKKTTAMKDQEDAKRIRAQLYELRTRVEAALKAAKFGEFSAAAELAIGNDLGAMRTLAGRVAAAVAVETTVEPAFDWQDSSTWVRKPIRYVGNGTQAYVNNLDAGYQNGLIKNIRECTAGDRHSHAVLTGVAMHDHTVAGSHGIAFCYNHLGQRNVEPVIYDYAESRDGSKYYWEHGAKSGGPPGVPEGVLSNRRD